MDSTNQVASKPRPDYDKWYRRAVWTKGLRVLVLARDPICRMCNRAASTIADHIVPHKGNWTLFCDMANLQGLCENCHSLKTAAEDGGYGNVRKSTGGQPGPVTTGEPGKQFQATTVSAKKIDEALSGDVAELLEGV